MKRRRLAHLLVLGLVATWVGCQSPSDNPSSDSQTTAGPAALGQSLLVHLRVPNMV